MTEKKFLLLSLEDSKTKKIANAVNNTTSKKILELLAEKTSTETEIAKKLDLPISSVHYNLKLLQEAKLVEWKEYHYSEKGKEVKHYSLANKYIIIAPKEERESIMEILKKIIPVFYFVLAFSAIVEMYNRFFGVEEKEVAVFEATAKIARDMDSAGINSVEEIAMITPEQSYDFLFVSEPTMYFFAGAMVALFLMFAFLYIKALKNTKKQEVPESIEF